MVILWHVKKEQRLIGISYKERGNLLFILAIKLINVDVVV
jgi:hypothetical protein